jgi:hypothetical protein
MQGTIHLARAQAASQLYETTTQMKTKTSKNAHRGGDFREFLDEQGILAEVEILALKRVVAIELQQILEEERITKTQLAARMKTSRASLDRILDPSNPSLTIASLGKAAAALGRKVELQLVPACRSSGRKYRHRLPARIPLPRPYRSKTPTVPSRGAAHRTESAVILLDSVWAGA